MKRAWIVGLTLAALAFAPLCRAEAGQPQQDDESEQPGNHQRNDSPAASHSAAIERGVDAFQREQYEQAASFLDQAHREDPRDKDTALLLGISYFNLGEMRAASPLFRQASSSSDPETASSAKSFLNLIAKRRTGGGAGKGSLTANSRTGGPELMASPRQLSEDNDTGAPLEYVLMLRSAYDSNVTFQQVVVPKDQMVADQADGFFFLLGALTYAPFDQIGFTIEDSLSYQAYLHMTDYSTLDNTLALRYTYRDAANQAEVNYSFGSSVRGQNPFALAHDFNLAYRRAIQSEWGIGARYQLGYTDFLLTDFAGHTGISHTGVLETGWGSPRRPFEVNAGFVMLRELTQDTAYAATGEGGRWYSRIDVTPAISLSLTGSAVLRNFDPSMDPSMPVRKDVQGSVDIWASANLNDQFQLQLGGSGLRNVSNVSAFDYTKVTVFLGLQYANGI